MSNFNLLTNLLCAFEHLKSLLVPSESVKHVRMLESELLILTSYLERLLEVLCLHVCCEARLLGPGLVLPVQLQYYKKYESGCEDTFIGVVQDRLVVQGSLRFADLFVEVAEQGLFVLFCHI